MGYGAEPGDFVIGEALPCRRGNCERTKQVTVGRLERVAGIGRSTEEAHEGAVRIGRDALLVGNKQLAVRRSSPAILTVHPTMELVERGLSEVGARRLIVLDRRVGGFVRGSLEAGDAGRNLARGW